MSASFQAVVNAPFGNRPTGELGVMSGLGNPIPYATGPGVAVSGGGGPYQQINVGDIMCQLDDNNYGTVAIPAAAVPLTATTYAASTASQKAMQQVHGAGLEAGVDAGGTCYGFLGISMSYRDPQNPSTPALGGSASRISIAPGGRAKMRLDPSDYNFANALPAGTLIGPSVNANGSTAGDFICTIAPGYVQSTQLRNGSTAGSQTVAATGASTPLTASEAIGRLAFDKAANDSFVYVDFVSTILAGGVQNTATTG
jgi:hypothetical protein